MIEILIDNTGFVSGDAWETVAYEGDMNSRIIHTIFNIPEKLVDKSFTMGYHIKSNVLNRTVDVPLDINNDISIPAEFMNASQKLWFQFYVRSTDFSIDNSESIYLFHSNLFSITVASSMNADADIILKPGANNFIVVQSIEERDSIPRSQLADGKIVKVANSDPDSCSMYTWDNTNVQWIEGAIRIADIFDLTQTLADIQERLIALEEKING